MAAEVLGALALVVAALAICRARTVNDAVTPPDRATAGARSPLLTTSDLVVLGIAGIATVATPAFWDDGWIRATIGGFSKLGAFSDYYAQADFPLPLGYWWLWLTRAWSQGQHPLVVLRIAPLLLVVVSWWILRRWVLDVIIPSRDRTLSRGVAALVFGLGSATFLVTLRSEPLIAFLLTLALVSLVRFTRQPGPRPLLALAALAALALTAHQTGAVVVLAGVAVVPGVARWSYARDRLSRATSVVVVAVMGIALALLLLGVDSDWHLTRAGIASIQAGGPYQNGVLDIATQRVDMLRQLDLVGLQRFWPALAVLLAVTYLVVGYGISNRGARLAGYAAVTGYAGLLLTGSPWPWHFGVIVPGAAVLAVLGVTRLLALGRTGIAVLVGLAIATTLALAWAMSSTRPWTAGDLADHVWADLPHLSVWEWAALATLGAVLGAAVTIRWRSAISRSGGAVMGAAAVMLCAPLALTWGLLLTDAAGSSGWSYTRQALKELTGRDQCGVGDFLPVVTDTTPLPETQVNQWAVPLASPDAYPPSTRTAVKPQGASVWGTYEAPGADQGRPATARVSTPWYDVHGRSEAVFWSLGRTRAPNGLHVEEVVERDGQRQEIVRHDNEPPLDSQWWAFHRIHLSPDARALRLVMTDGDLGGSAWLATTGPVVPQYASFTDVTKGDAVWRNPSSVLALPCRPLPSAAGGVIQSFRWSLGPPDYHAKAIAAEYPTVERGCFYARGLRLCALELLATG